MASTYQYWRLYFTAVNGGSGQNVFIGAWGFYDGNMNSISTSSATATSSTGGSPWNAINGTGFGWGSSTPPSTSPQWLQVQFTSAVTVSFISIQSGGSWLTSSPINFLIQGSPDGSTWTTINTVSGVIWYDLGEYLYFDASSTVGLARVTAVGLEVMSQVGATARISQTALEVIGGSKPNAIFTQIALEVMYPWTAPPTKPVMEFLLP